MLGSQSTILNRMIWKTSPLMTHQYRPPSQPYNDVLFNISALINSYYALLILLALASWYLVFSLIQWFQDKLSIYLVFLAPALTHAEWIGLVYGPTPFSFNTFLFRNKRLICIISSSYVRWFCTIALSSGVVRDVIKAASLYQMALQNLAKWE